MPKAEPRWAKWSDEQLLDLRICDLGLRIPDTVLSKRIAQLYRELERRRIRFRPYFWLSEEWFTPDGATGIAIPFYLAHPRLQRLEETQMLEAEGGTPEWCMRILRHETGHALDNAYRLRRRRARQQMFGRSSQPYPRFYTPRPYSRSFVRNLEPWYGQSHPDEDFAETFAVWLDPRGNWRQRYADWPALRKLQSVDEILGEIASTQPPLRTRHLVDPISRLERTLGQHYKRKRLRYGIGSPNVYDEDLRRLFSDAPAHRRNPSAARLLTRIRPEVRRLVANETGAYQYTVDQVIDDIIIRCRELRLRLRTSVTKTKLEVTALLIVQAMNYLHTGKHRVWL